MKEHIWQAWEILEGDKPSTTSNGKN